MLLLRLPAFCLLFLFCAILPAADKPSERTFRMGFTGFPHDITLPAVIEARKFCRDNGDIIAHHIEGVAWTECLQNKPFPKKRLIDWKGKKEAGTKKGKVYLAISPGRGSLQLLEDCQPIAKELQGKPYDDPLVMRTYLAYCRRMIEIFEPDYLAIGIEVNDIYKDAGSDVWKAYVGLHKHVYKALKREHKDLPIFASATLHNMLVVRGKKRQEYINAFSQIMPYCDYVAVSYYPFIQAGTTETAKSLAWLDDSFGKYNKPFAFVETGEAAQKITLPSSGQKIRGTAEKQRQFMIQLLLFAETHDTKFVVWFIHRDYDAMWDKIKKQKHVPEAFMVWRDCGLLDEEGNQRPAFSIWEKYFKKSLR